MQPSSSPSFRRLTSFSAQSSATTTTTTTGVQSLWGGEIILLLLSCRADSHQSQNLPVESERQDLIITYIIICCNEQPSLLHSLLCQTNWIKIHICLWDVVEQKYKVQNLNTQVNALCYIPLLMYWHFKGFNIAFDTGHHFIIQDPWCRCHFTLGFSDAYSHTN